MVVLGPDDLQQSQMPYYSPSPAPAQIYANAAVTPIAQPQHYPQYYPQLQQQQQQQQQYQSQQPPQLQPQLYQQQPLLQNATTPSSSTSSVSPTQHHVTVNSYPMEVPQLSSDVLRQHLLTPFEHHVAGTFAPPEYSPVQKVELISGPSSQYRDKFWAVLYLLHFFAFTIGGIYAFYREFNSLGAFSFNMRNETIGIMVLVIGISISLSLLALLMAKYHPKFMLLTSIFCGFGFWIAIFIVSALYTTWVWALFVAVFFLIYAYWVYCIRQRIQFAVAMLRQASEVIARWPTTIILAFASMAVEVFLMCLWVVSSVGIFVAANSDRSGAWEISNRGWGSVFLIIFSMFWTTQVVKNTLHCTISGLTSYWYFLYPTSQSSNPTLHSLKRASTTSFGSICLGSLVLVIVRTLRSIARMLAGGSSGPKNIVGMIFCCCGRVLLYFIDAIITYVNVYAFVQVSVYGKSYCTGAKDAITLLRKRGFVAIMNDSLIGILLTYTSLVSGFICGLLVSGITNFLGNDGYISWGVAAGIFGFSVTLIAMEVLDSAIVTIFVCLAEDPTTLYRTKPESYQNLIHALAIGYPKIVSRQTLAPSPY
jgi:hypothetical protein